MIFITAWKSYTHRLPSIERIKEANQRRTQTAPSAIQQLHVVSPTKFIVHYDRSDDVIFVVYRRYILPLWWRQNITPPGRVTNSKPINGVLMLAAATALAAAKLTNVTNGGWQELKCRLYWAYWHSFRFWLIKTPEKSCTSSLCLFITSPADRLHRDVVLADGRPFVAPVHLFPWKSFTSCQQFQIFPAASPETIITSHSMKNQSAFHTSLRSWLWWVPILTTYCTSHFISTRISLK